MQLKALRIEGAIVMPAMKIEGDVRIPKRTRQAYKYLFAMDGVPFASKDLKTAEIAVSVLVNGEQRNPTDFIKDLEEGEK
mgnify:CR=1 FL=1